MYKQNNQHQQKNQTDIPHNTVPGVSIIRGISFASASSNLDPEGTRKTSFYSL